MHSGGEEKGVGEGGVKVEGKGRVFVGFFVCCLFLLFGFVSFGFVWLL